MRWPVRAEWSCVDHRPRYWEFCPHEVACAPCCDKYHPSTSSWRSSQYQAWCQSACGTTSHPWIRRQSAPRPSWVTRPTFWRCARRSGKSTRWRGCLRPRPGSAQTRCRPREHHPCSEIRKFTFDDRKLYFEFWKKKKFRTVFVNSN